MILTSGQLRDIAARIDEIEQTMDLCDPDRDGDVLDALDSELETIIATLDASHERALRSECAAGPCLKLIGGPGK